MSHTSYAPKRTFLVNSATTGNGTNYLMRGNIPLKKDGATFAYDEMNTRFKELISDGSFDLANYNLIDISVITNYPTTEPGEGFYLMAEFLAYGISNADYNKWFPQSVWPPFMTKQCPQFAVPQGSTINGNSGSIIWYPVQGCDPAGTCSTIEPQQYNPVGLVDMLNTLLNTANANGKPTLIYYHCINGHDRTSALTACYMMRWMGSTYTFDYVTTTPAPKGAMLENNHGVQWNPPYINLVKYYSENCLPQVR